jgi:hypothetical protein
LPIFRFNCWSEEKVFVTPLAICPLKSTRPDESETNNQLLARVAVRTTSTPCPVETVPSSAGTWFHSDNVVGRAVYAFVYGGVGQIGFFAPVVLLYFAFRLFRVPEDSRATGRIIIGTLALLLSSTGLAHLLNGSIGTGATAMREGGGWLLSLIHI